MLCLYFYKVENLSVTYYDYQNDVFSNVDDKLEDYSEFFNIKTELPGISTTVSDVAQVLALNHNAFAPQLPRAGWHAFYALGAPDLTNEQLASLYNQAISGDHFWLSKKYIRDAKSG